jgi:hypothetical protein
VADEEQFLETTGETAGDIELATGIDWSALGKAIIGSLVATYFLAVNAGISVFSTIFEATFGGVGGWLGDAIETAVGVPESFLRTAQLTSLEAISGVPTILAYPIGVALVLGSLWIVARGVEVIR